MPKTSVEGHFIVTARNAREGKDYELLFLSRKIPFTRTKTPTPWTLVISDAFAEKAQKEIELCQEENPGWPSPCVQAPPKVYHLPFIHEIVLLCLAVFHWMAGASESWVENGRVSAGDILSGEWMRSITALTLHGNYVHLFGNLAALWLFVNGVSQYVGSGVAWLLVLLSGVLGNLMSASFYGEGHFSIGASTSVFGAVGILGGMKAGKGFHERQPWKRRIVPVGAAVALLAMLGADPKSDVMAHLFGLAAGLGLGLLWAFIFSEKAPGNITVQWVAFGIFCGMVVLSWMARL